MKTLFSILALLIFCNLASAQDHGSVTYKGQTISLTGYRTRVTNGKRSIIADGKKDAKLYSITITLKPDVTVQSDVKTDATHSVTLTISNADYSSAQNFCFDGGSSITISPKAQQFAATAKELTPGNCFGKSETGDKISFNIKP